MTKIKEPYPDCNFLNRIADLLKNDDVEFALSIIYKCFDKMTRYEKYITALNVKEAHKQYRIPHESLPASYYEYLRNNGEPKLIVVFPKQTS